MTAITNSEKTVNAQMNKIQALFFSLTICQQSHKDIFMIIKTKFMDFRRCHEEQLGVKSKGSGADSLH